MSTTPEDDEALSWDGLEPDHVAAPARGSAPTAGVQTSSATVARDAQAPRAPGSAMLIGYGIIGGINLLYMIGWVIAIQRDTFSQSSLFAEIMYQLGEFLAIASPAVWMVAVLILTRHSRPAVRLFLLVVGVLLLAPWPFILGG